VADTVQNDLVVGGNDTFTLGGSTSVGYWIQAGGQGGNPGCDVSSDGTATFTINVPSGSGITAAPASLTFDACNDPQDVSFIATTAGDFEITVDFVFGEGTYNTNSATLTLHVLEPETPADETPPSISYVLTPPSPDGSNGWYTSDVTLTWIVDEPESPSSLVKTGCLDQNITADQFETAYSCSATSDGGPAGPVTVSIKRDATDPEVSLVGGPADGSSHYFGFVPAAPTCDASDVTSGLAGACSVSGYGDTVGNHTVTASAFDNAGNEGTDSASYTVLAWTLNGFYRPVEMDGVWNTVKGGSTVPLKFNVFAGATELTDVGVVKSFAAVKVACEVGGAEDDVEFTTTGGTSLRYDWTDGQFIQNWKTPKSTGCYRVTMTTQDLSTIIAFFKLK
jgi:hypothetical protein